MIDSVVVVRVGRSWNRDGDAVFVTTPDATVPDGTR